MGANRATLFERLKNGLEEGIAFERGETTLRVRQVIVPDEPRAYSATDIRRIRIGLNLSQTGFARLLHVSCKTVQGWEQGIRPPRHSSARLLQFIEHPEMLSEVSQLGPQT